VEHFRRFTISGAMFYNQGYRSFFVRPGSPAAACHFKTAAAASFFWFTWRA
jgi:hypothetical protein